MRRLKSVWPPDKLCNRGKVHANLLFVLISKAHLGNCIRNEPAVMSQRARTSVDHRQPGANNEPLPHTSKVNTSGRQTAGGFKHRAKYQLRQVTFRTWESKCCIIAKLTSCSSPGRIPSVRRNGRSNVGTATAFRRSNRSSNRNLPVNLAAGVAGTSSGFPRR